MISWFVMRGSERWFHKIVGNRFLAETVDHAIIFDLLKPYQRAMEQPSFLAHPGAEG